MYLLGGVIGKKVLFGKGVNIFKLVVVEVGSELEYLVGLIMQIQFNVCFFELVNVNGLQYKKIIVCLLQEGL